MFSRAIIEPDPHGFQSYHNYLVKGRLMICDGFIGIKGELQGATFNSRSVAQRQAVIDFKHDITVTPPAAANAVDALAQSTPPIGYRTEDKGFWVQVTVQEGPMHASGRQEPSRSIIGFKSIKSSAILLPNQAIEDIQTATTALDQAKSAFVMSRNRPVR